VTLTLYFAPGSSSMAPHIALHEIGVPFEGRPISLGKRETRRPEYLALNPEGHVPLLLIDGRPLTQVAAILFYLARRFPEARLMPEAGLEQEAHVVSWLSFLASGVHPARRQGLEAVRAAHGLAQAKLGKKEWALGSYSIVDIFLFRLFWRVSSSLPLTRAEFPDLFAHQDRVLARPAVARTIAVESALGYEFTS
jgi:glutathione S-transferase